MFFEFILRLPAEGMIAQHVQGVTLLKYGVWGESVYCKYHCWISWKQNWVEKLECP